MGMFPKAGKHEVDGREGRIVTLDFWERAEMRSSTSTSTVTSGQEQPSGCAPYNLRSTTKLIT